MREGRRERREGKESREEEGRDINEKMECSEPEWEVEKKRKSAQEVEGDSSKP